MARLPRYKIRNQTQHIVLQGADSLQVFFADQDYQYFHDCLDAACYNNQLALHAYVLMPDHVHMLATPRETNSISRTIQSIGRNYVQYYNECYGGSGSVWEGRYRATVIDEKAYLLTCSRYIELNPVRNGICKGPQDYKWSSYAHNAQGRKDEMISTHREYQALGENDKQRVSEYRALFRQKLAPETVQQITDSALRGWALGDARFVRKIEKLGGRRATPLPKGRPRKN